MEHYDTRANSTDGCIVDGCSLDVVCLDVHIRYRREPIASIHSTVCATHAVSEGLRVGYHCDSHSQDTASTEAEVDMDWDVAAYLRSRNQ